MERDKLSLPELTELRRRWSANRDRLRQILARIDPCGLTRPARDPDERAWLDNRGEQPFVDDEDARRAADAYYSRRYRR